MYGRQRNDEHLEEAGGTDASHVEAGTTAGGLQVNLVMTLPPSPAQGWGACSSHSNLGKKKAGRGA